MDATISLRPIREDDREFLYRVYASTRQDVRGVPWSDEEKEQFLRFQFEAQHAYYLQQFADAQFEVILSGGREVGRLYVDRREDEIRIVDIALLPEYRGNGIGSRIIGDLLFEARRAAKPIRIHVEPQSPALGLYQRLGFRKIGDTGTYYLMEWIGEDDGAIG